MAYPTNLDAKRGMGPLDAYPGYLIRRMHQISAAHFARVTGTNQIDLTPVQFAALRTIVEYPGLDQVTVASRISYDRVTIGGVIDRLVSKELVERRQSPSDRRARELVATPLGKRMIDAMLPLVDEVQGSIVANLSDKEIETLLSLLKKAIGE